MPGSSSPFRVLVVDDDLRIADTLALVLRQNGFDARAAYSGPEAIEAALKSPPNFIVMDVFMGDIDGVDSAIAITEALPHCRILLISGHVDALQRLTKGTARGHNFDLMMKPIQIPALLDRLRSPDDSGKLPN